MELECQMHDDRPSILTRLRDLTLGAMLRDCAEVEARDDKILVRSVVHSFAFDPDRLFAARSKIVELIREIVDLETYGRHGRGKGGSFLGLCIAGSGEHWGEHPDVEMLLAVAIPLGLAGWCAPRSFWPLLPVGMPYVWFDPDADDLIAKSGWTTRSFD